MKLRIKEVCQMRNTTQKELAEKIGVSEVTLSRASMEIHRYRYLKGLPMYWKLI